MNRAISLLAMSGLASAAAGQSLSVSLSFDATSIAIGETATATLSASFTGQPAGAYLSSVNIDLVLLGGPRLDVSNVSAVAWNNVSLGFDGQGTASGSDVLGIEAAQFSLIPPITAGSPMLICTFTVTGNACPGPGGFYQYEARTSRDAPFAFSVTGGAFADPVVSYGTEVFHAQGLTACPSPGCFSIAAAGLGVGLRKRRSA